MQRPFAPRHAVQRTRGSLYRRHEELTAAPVYVGCVLLADAREGAGRTGNERERELGSLGRSLGSEQTDAKSTGCTVPRVDASDFGDNSVSSRIYLKPLSQILHFFCNPITISLCLKRATGAENAVLPATTIDLTEERTGGERHNITDKFKVSRGGNQLIDLRATFRHP